MKTTPSRFYPSSKETAAAGIESFGQVSSSIRSVLGPKDFVNLYSIEQREQRLLLKVRIPHLLTAKIKIEPSEDVININGTCKAIANKKGEHLSIMQDNEFFDFSVRLPHKVHRDKVGTSIIKGVLIISLFKI